MYDQLAKTKEPQGFKGISLPDCQIAKPLTDLIKKDAFEWTDTEITAFEQLKQVMSNTPVLALPNFAKTFSTKP